MPLLKKLFTSFLDKVAQSCANKVLGGDRFSSNLSSELLTTVQHVEFHQEQHGPLV